MPVVSQPVHRIELRLREMAQLFNSMDPSPFHQKDLDPDAEAFIESWAMEFPPGGLFDITVHLEQRPRDGDPAALMTEGIRHYFAYRAELKERELKQLWWQGRVSLAIGLGFLAVCLLIAEAMAGLTARTFVSVLRESLTIAGWVAMWRPMQIFLYEWWPLLRRLRIYRGLSQARVHVT